MGLFSKAQAAKIMATAKKSKAPVKPAQKKVNTKTITAEIARISKEVIEYFKDSKAELITTKEQLHDYVSKMIEAGIGGIDTETTGLDRVHDTIVGTSLYYPGGVEVYIPINHIIPIFNEPYKNQLSYEDVGKEYARFIEAKTKLIFANADFDLGFIFKDMHVDLITCCFFDVIIAWRCLKEDEKSNALKVLYAKYVLGGKGDPKRFSDFFTPELFPYCDPNVAKLYAANDAKITYELFMWQLPYIKKDNPLCKKHGFEALSDLIWNVEIPMIAVAQKMHRQGMFIEKEVSDMLIHKYHKLLDNANLKLQSMIDEVMNGGQYVSRTKPPFYTPQDFNPNSSKHVEWLAYDLLGLNDGRSKGTDKEVLKTFNNPILNQILYCRSLVTLISTFVDKIPESVAEDHRIHCTFKTIGADTGRMSSADPMEINLNWGLKIRLIQGRAIA